jgi:hypothetical protein
MTCLNASISGLELINYHRRLKGWTKQSTMWACEAHVSEATLKRFWRRRKIRYHLFIKIVNSVGITDWERVAELQTPQPQGLFSGSEFPIVVSYQEMPQYYGLLESRIQGCNIMYSDRLWHQLHQGLSGLSGNSVRPVASEANYCMV